MGIEIVTLTLGVVQTNCYLVGDTGTLAAIAIDPADDAGAILAAARERGWILRQILATHAHFDHVLAADDLRAATGAPFLIHKADRTVLQAMQITGEWFGLQLPPPPEPDGFVEDGDRVAVDGIALEVRHTPGHSPGHVSYVLASEKWVFSGDCLFAGSVGRTDLPGGNHAQLMRSIIDRLLPLGDDFTVAAGHGPLTSIGAERASNPFLEVDVW